MRIDFPAMEDTVIPQFYGGQGDTVARMFSDEHNRILCGKLEPGSSIGLHRHNAGSEIIYILAGTGKALFDGSEESLTPGQCHYCPKGHAHSLINSGGEPLVFFAVVPQQ